MQEGLLEHSPKLLRRTIEDGRPTRSPDRRVECRSRPANLDSCDIHNELLELQWFGNTAEIRIKPDFVFPCAQQSETGGGCASCVPR